MNDLVVAPGLQSEDAFKLLHREAVMFAASSMVPDTFRDYVLDKATGEWTENKQALSNSMIALNMAMRLRADPLMVMQNLYIVHGVPAWSAKFLIGLFNTCGRFTTIRYAFSEKRDLCFAHCKELATGERIEGPSVSLAMAKAEGWMDRKGSKWRTMPEVMLMNRAAAFLIRGTAPELSLGLPMRDEAEDIVEVDMPEAKVTPLQTVRDILQSQTPRRSVSEPPAEADNEPAVEPTMDEPQDLPLKDGEVSEADAMRIAKSKTKETPFDPDAYAARIEKIGDVDLLQLMKEEIATLPPSVRADMAALIDSRIHSLIPDEREAS